MSDPLNSEIKQAIVRCLRLPTAAEEIGDLFGLLTFGRARKVREQVIEIDA